LRGGTGPDSLLDQAWALLRTFRRSGDVGAVQRAAGLLREADTATSPGDPRRPLVLSTLGAALQDIFEATGDPGALAKAVECGRAAVAAVSSETEAGQSAWCYSGLGRSLFSVFEYLGDLGSLSEAVIWWRRAVEASQSAGSVPLGILSNLGMALRSLWEQTGDQDALLEAVQLGQQAATAVTADDPVRAVVLNNLGIALRALFETTGQRGALDDAVRVGRAAVAATFPGDPGRAVRSSNLSMALLTVAEVFGDTDALAEAVQAGRDAVADTLPGSPVTARHLSNLGGALSLLYRRDGSLAALEEAVQMLREAVAATAPGHPEMNVRQRNLSIALRSLFERTGDPGTLAEAVQAARDAVSGTAPGNFDYPLNLSHLGGVLNDLFAHGGDQAYLEESMGALRLAATSAPPDHPQRAACLYNLAAALVIRFSETRDVAVLSELRQICRTVARMGAASAPMQVQAAATWGWAAMLADDGADALAGYETAISVLPRAAPSRVSDQDRERSLRDLGGLAGEAASVAIHQGKAERAVELLEHGRGLLLADAIAQREIPGELIRLAPDLVALFGELRRELAAVRTSVPAAGSSQAWYFADRRRELSERWDALLTRIRGIPGLSRFLLPPLIGELSAQAVPGPIVMINASMFRCDALILTGNPARPVRVVPLPGITRVLVVEKARDLIAVTEGSPDDRPHPHEDLQSILAWLWDEIAAPVVAELREIGAAGPDRRVWWCPAGEMVLLPLHAAGRPGDPAGPATVMDCMVPSYTPTIRALAHLRQRPTEPAVPEPASGALIISMPHTPAEEPLPGARAEAELVTRLLPASATLTGAAATHDAVLRMLPRYRIVHLACHGRSVPGDPAAGTLLLYDHLDRPLTVAEIGQLQLPSRELAYLSACRTATSDPRLPDEAIHLTGAFQLAGYGQVIGTLWPVSDQVAVAMANGIYADLTGNGTGPIQPERAARALHRAALRLRARYPQAPHTWAAYLHAGL
jgi:tetratricopeptide (TPR) repeat protein